MNEEKLTKQQLIEKLAFEMIQEDVRELIQSSRNAALRGKYWDNKTIGEKATVFALAVYRALQNLIQYEESNHEEE